MKMPKINIQAMQELSTDDAAIVKCILGRESRLRAGPPKKDDNNKAITGAAYYVWRMAAFQVSPNSTHWCMPVLADFRVQVSDYHERKAFCKKLDLLVDKICNTIPKNEWHGINRWATALGYGR